MPVYDRRTIQALYWRRGPVVDGVRQPGTTYGRGWSDELFDRRLGVLLDLGVSGRVLVVGSGFGFLIERLLDAGVDAWGCEPGPFYWEETNAGVWRDDVKQRTYPGTVEEFPETGFDWVVDEDAAPAADDTAGFLAACRERGGRVVHFVTADEPGGRDTSHTWMLLDEWRALSPEDVWIANGTI